MVMVPPLSLSMEKNFRVIIVGGSIAGLALAHCLNHAGVDYVVLERHDDVAPQVGASVGIMPNGARILDQLGLFDAVEAEIEPLDKSHIWYPDGFGFTSAFSTVLKKQFGYPVSFLDRQLLLRILYQSLRDKGKLHLNKTVFQLEYFKSEVRVHTSDGSCYEGNLIVGADGVHSRVRTEMWQDAGERSPGLITMKEKSSMTVDFTCVYGISSAVPGLEVGEQITCFFDGLTILTFHGKRGRVFWFVIQKTPVQYTWPDVPRFTKADAEKVCASLQSRKIHQAVRFGHIWTRQESYTMTALEENVFEHWHFGRVVCFGDSMHKMTPNFGQGANSAIESAAALANALRRLLHSQRQTSPSDTELDALLTAFSQRRRRRTKGMLRQARFVTRLHARDGLFNILVGRYLVPYAGDLPASMAGKVIVGAEKLDFLPLPARTEKGWPRPDGDIGRGWLQTLKRGVVQVWDIVVPAMGFVWPVGATFLPAIMSVKMVKDY